MRDARGMGGWKVSAEMRVSGYAAEGDGQGCVVDGGYSRAKERRERERKRKRMQRWGWGWS